jgi:hypothetical protein
MARAMLAHIAEVTDRPVRYPINTRSQPRRVLGNAVMWAASIEVVAGAPVAPRIAGQGAAMAVGAEGMLGIEAGGIQPPGAPDRLIVHLAEDNLVFAGDVL